MLADRTYNQKLSFAAPIGYFHVKGVHIKLILATASIARIHINHESAQNNFGYYISFYALLFTHTHTYTQNYTKPLLCSKKNQTHHSFVMEKKLNVCIVLYSIGEFANIAQIPMCVCICLSIVDFVFIHSKRFIYLFISFWLNSVQRVPSSTRPKPRQRSDQQMNQLKWIMCANHRREIKRTIERMRQKWHFFLCFDAEFTKF